MEVPSSPVAVAPPSVSPSPPVLHEHGDSLEEQAVHEMAQILETPKSGLKAWSSDRSMRLEGAMRMTVSYTSRRTDSPTPKYGGIVIDGVLHMGHDAVSQAVLSAWAKGSVSPGADDLAWLATYESSCRTTTGPTEPPIDPQCEGHSPRLITHTDGRRGVRYWTECPGGMHRTTSQSLWDVWIQPDLTMKEDLVAVCSAGTTQTTTP